MYSWTLLKIQPVKGSLKTRLIPELWKGKYKMTHTYIYGGEEKALAVKDQLLNAERMMELGNH